MDLELFRQFRHCLVPFDRSQRHLGLKGRAVISSRSLHRLAPLVHYLAVAFVKPGYHLPYCQNFRSLHLPYPKLPWAKRVLPWLHSVFPIRPPTRDCEGQ